MIEIVDGVILRAEDQGDFDQRLTIYTKELGKLKAKISGVKKTVSKLRSLALPFVESRFQLYLHGTPRAGLNDPGKIVGGEALAYHISLRKDWDRMIQTAAFCETLDRLTHAFYPNEQEYEILTSCLAQMETTVNPLLVRLRSTLMLLKVLGYSLRHHAAWQSCTDRQKNLLLDLARWDCSQELFTTEESVDIERISTAYLSQYLPGPLKTQVFQHKIGTAAMRLS